MALQVAVAYFYNGTAGLEASGIRIRWKGPPTPSDAVASEDRRGAEIPVGSNFLFHPPPGPKKEIVYDKILQRVAGRPSFYPERCLGQEYFALPEGGVGVPQQYVVAGEAGILR